ncbi:MAG: DUF2889 domain-containing protein [Gammaproteobacteria bacterium]|nr:DUF2889 domain-containing protein [Gammaproteobacteria bacterium]
MPLSTPRARRHYHTRRVHCEGYLREDGLWDIEARLGDTKTYAFDNDERGRVEPGQLLHGMALRLTLDDAMVIQGVEAAIDHSPFDMCTDITDHYHSLVGLTIKPGFTLRLKERVGGTRGCTHLTELIGVMATVAFQTIHGSGDRAVAEGRKAPPDDGGRPAHLGGCHALASHSPVVALHWPQHFAGEAVEG